jgi:hypothetical protein
LVRFRPVYNRVAMKMLTYCLRCDYRFPEPAPDATCPECGGRTITSAVVHPGTPPAYASTAATFISYGQFARSWYRDALREVAESFAGDMHGRRREVVFATCCAESYLYEWALDRLRAKLDPAAAFDKLEAYFKFTPPHRAKSGRDRDHRLGTSPKPPPGIRHGWCQQRPGGGSCTASPGPRLADAISERPVDAHSSLALQGRLLLRRGSQVRQSEQQGFPALDRHPQQMPRPKKSRAVPRSPSMTLQR